MLNKKITNNTYHVGVIHGGEESKGTLQVADQGESHCCRVGSSNTQENLIRFRGSTDRQMNAPAVSNDEQRFASISFQVLRRNLDQLADVVVGVLGVGANPAAQFSHIAHVLVRHGSVQEQIDRRDLESLVTQGLQRGRIRVIAYGIRKNERLLNASENRMHLLTSRNWTVVGWNP